ncbi:UNVERIFIED_CONTAM: hypothetical protein K2H54_036511 [Gekko kuhli]
MCALGHNRSGEECRAKTKAMRLQYRRTLEHNSTSGNHRTTCPYIRQLDEILHGEGMMRPRRTQNSLPLDTLPAPGTATGSADGDVAPRQERFRLNLETEEEGTPPEVLVPETQDLSEDQGTPDNDDNDDETQVEEETPAGPSHQPRPGVGQPPHRRTQDGADVAPGVILGQLSPRACMAVIRARRQRVSALQRVGEHLLEQGERQFQAMVAAAQNDRDHFEQQLHHSRQEEQAAIQATDEILRETLNRLSLLADALMQPQAMQRAGRVQHIAPVHLCHVTGDLCCQGLQGVCLTHCWPRYASRRNRFRAPCETRERQVSLMDIA